MKSYCLNCRKIYEVKRVNSRRKYCDDCAKTVDKTKQYEKRKQSAIKNQKKWRPRNAEKIHYPNAPSLGQYQFIFDIDNKICTNCGKAITDSNIELDFKHYEIRCNCGLVIGEIRVNDVLSRLEGMGEITMEDYDAHLAMYYDEKRESLFIVGILLLAEGYKSASRMKIKLIQYNIILIHPVHVPHVNTIVKWYKTELKDAVKNSKELFRFNPYVDQQPIIIKARFILKKLCKKEYKTDFDKLTEELREIENNFSFLQLEKIYKENNMDINEPELDINAVKSIESAIKKKIDVLKAEIKKKNIVILK